MADTDYYSALLNPAPSPDEVLRSMAKQLRRAERRNDFATMTADPVLMKQAGGLVERGRADIDHYQDTRLKDEQRRAGERYNMGMLENQRAQLAETKRYHDMAIAQKRDELLNAPIKYKPLTKAEQDDLLDTSGKLSAVKSILEFAAPKEVNIGSTGVPFGRTALNFAAKWGVGGDDDKRIALAWQTYKDLYEAVKRHNFYGAALTKYEINEWGKANPGPEMDEEQIVAGMRIIEKSLAHRLAQRSRGLARDGRNPEAIQEYVGDVQAFEIPELTLDFAAKREAAQAAGKLGVTDWEMRSPTATYGTEAPPLDEQMAEDPTAEPMDAVEFLRQSGQLPAQPQAPAAPQPPAAPSGLRTLKPVNGKWVLQ